MMEANWEKMIAHTSRHHQLYYSQHRYDHDHFGRDLDDVSKSKGRLGRARHYASLIVATRHFRIFITILALVLITQMLSSSNMLHLRHDDNSRVRKIPDPDAGVAHVIGIHFFDAEENKWRHIQNSEAEELGRRRESPRSNFALITWNIDFSISQPQNRIAAAISYLRSLLISGTDQPDSISPAIIVLQEITADMVKRLANSEWVRKHFYMTDVRADEGIWLKSHYGTVTLVDRRIPIKNAIRLHYDSNMGRDCLFVDIEAVSAETSENVLVRVGNTHLESLVQPTPMRSEQLRLAANFILNDASVYTGLVAGDMNPIEKFDATLPADVGLKDAYLENGGDDEDEKGHTWGYQTEDNKFPKRRFDKILYSPNGKIKMEQVEVIGVGEKTMAQPRVWVSDHFGVLANVRIR
ncbi:hypothetical protein TWF694_010812 [Orbilia ellipsospora]|uniref:Endonuclease/exonuclease/phosphatase domain-containing protein n=1 Tax=Orbilia ellipsospora TaxID=2528407 RepID=A0AAV9X9Q8_9PEZI